MKEEERDIKPPAKPQKINPIHATLTVIVMIMIIVAGIIFFKCQKEIDIEKLTFSYSETTLYKGELKRLDLEIYPANVTRANIVWSSSNTEVAKYDKKGFIEARNYGEATITAQVKNTDIKAECKVIVGDGEIYTVNVSDPLKIYYVGQTFDASELEVVGIYQSDKKVLLDPSEYTVEGPETLELGSEIKIIYKDLSPKIIFPIVLEDFVSDIEITSLPTKTNYVIGEEIDLTGLEVGLVYASGKREVATNYFIDTTKVAYKQTEVKITYGLYTKTFAITTQAQITVDSMTKLQTAINNGYTSIMIAEGSYNVTTPIILSNVQDVIIFSKSPSTAINGYNTTAIKIEGSCGNITFDNITVTSTGDTPSQYQFDLSSCEGGNINLINVIYTEILQPETPNYTLKTN